MRSLKKIKMKKTTKRLSTKDEVRKARHSLEKETEKAFNEFAKSKQKDREMAHLKFLD
jgi:hypothetical protein